MSRRNWIYLHGRDFTTLVVEWQQVWQYFCNGRLSGTFKINDITMICLKRNQVYADLSQSLTGYECYFPCVRANENNTVIFGFFYGKIESDCLIRFATDLLQTSRFPTHHNYRVSRNKLANGAKRVWYTHRPQNRDGTRLPHHSRPFTITLNAWLPTNI